MSETIPLDAWIEESGLESFVDDNLIIHLKQWGITEEDDLDSLVRCIMITLRQELTDNDWRRHASSKR